MRFRFVFHFNFVALLLFFLSFRRTANRFFYSFVRHSFFYPIFNSFIVLFRQCARVFIQNYDSEPSSFRNECCSTIITIRCHGPGKRFASGHILNGFPTFLQNTRIEQLQLKRNCAFEFLFLSIQLIELLWNFLLSIVIRLLLFLKYMLDITWAMVSLQSNATVEMWWCICRQWVWFCQSNANI